MSVTLGAQLVGMMPLGVAVYDPAVLNLTEWFRASYVGLPHAGPASAGTSGAHTLTTGLTAPDVGTAVNGYTPIGCTPTGDKCAKDASTVVSSLITAAAYTIILLVKPKGSTGSRNATDAYLEKALVAEIGSGGAYVGMGYSTSGFSAYHLSGGAWDGPVVAAPLNGSWYLAVARYDGTDLKIGVNGVYETPLAKGNVSANPGQPPSRLVLGTNYQEAGGGQECDVLEFMVAPSYLSDPTIANIKSYANARYALSL